MKGILESACTSGALSKELGSENLEDMRVKMKGILESACTSGALSKALGSENLEDIRVKMKGILESACTSGALSNALGDITMPTKIDVEAMRLQLKVIMETACDSGHLVQALEQIRGSDQEVCSPNVCQHGNIKAAQGLEMEMADLKADMRARLNAACINGDLANALGAVSPEPATTALVPVKPAGPSSSSGAFIRRNLLGDFAAAGELAAPAMSTLLPQGAAARVLQSISSCTRRAGALNALIKDAEQRLLEQDECCMRLEVEIAAARREAMHLDVELDHSKHFLDHQEETNVKLFDSQRRLLDGLDDEALKQRHRRLESDPNVYSARSDLSTACTVRDLASTPLSSSRIKGTGLPLISSDETGQGRPGAITAPPRIC
jgi:hypothetical protein